MPDEPLSHASISKGDFHFDEVRPTPRTAAELAAPPPSAPLGPLSNITGEFASEAARHARERRAVAAQAAFVGQDGAPFAA